MTTTHHDAAGVAKGRAPVAPAAASVVAGDAAAAPPGGAMPEGAAGAGAPARPAARDGGLVLRAPLAGWQVALLTVLTVGLYVPFWGLRTCRDLRAAGVPTVGPIASFLGYLVALFSPFVSASHARGIRTALERRRIAPAPSVQAVVALYVVVLALGIAERAAGLPVTFWASVGWYALVAVPVVLMNAGMNRYKESLRGVEWIGRPYRLRAVHYAALLAGAFVTWNIVQTEYLGVWPLLHADARVAQGDVVRGAGDRYRLVVPTEGWYRLRAGDLPDDRDFELRGADGESWVIGRFEASEALTVRDAVLWRREAIEAASADLEITEERRLGPTDLIPRSFARYRTRDPALPFLTDTWWAATARTQEGIVEVVGYASGDGEQVVRLEQLVKSLEVGTP